MTTNKFLRYGILTGIFILPFTPLLVSSSLYFPFISEKNFFFRIVVELILAAYVVLAFRDEAFQPKRSFVLYAVLIFLGVIGVADIFSANPFKSFWSNFERMEGYITLLHLAAYFTVLGAVLDTDQLWKRFLQTNLAASLLVSGYGILQLMGVYAINQGGVRLDATFGNATYLAVYMLLNIFIALFLLFRERLYVSLRYVYGAIILLDLFLLFKTETRGAVLGLIVSLFVSAFLIGWLEKGRPILRKIGWITVGAVVALVLIFVAVKDTKFVKETSVLTRLSSISINEGASRFMVWNMAWKGFKDSPKTVLIGWGQESFNYVFNKYYDPEMYTQEQWFDRTHNIVFDWLIAGGVLGLLSYLFLFVAALFHLWSRELAKIGGHFSRRFFGKFSPVSASLSVTEKSVLTGLLAGYFFQNIFVFDNIVSYIMFFLVLAYIHKESAVEFGPKVRRSFSLSSDMVARVVAPVTIVLLVSVIYFANIKPILAGSTLIESLRSHAGGPAENLKLFQKALSYRSLADYEIREQLVQAAAQVVNAQNIDATVKQDFFDVTKAEMEKQVAETPNDARYQLFTGVFLNRAGQAAMARPYLEKALSLSPRKQTILFEVGTAYLNIKDYKKAKAIFKEAFDLEPKFDEARLVYAVSAIYAGDTQLLKDLVMEKYGTTLVNDDRFIRAYYDTKQYDKVVAIWRKRVTENPNNTTNHLSLAAAYLSNGNRDLAIAEIRKAIALDPNMKDQGNFYISEIQAGRNP